jgi:hypothetical protein
MTRRAAIEIDLAATGELPDRWTSSWVQCRIVEAYQVERRLPGVAKFFNSGTWPIVNYEFADVVAQGENASANVLDTWQNERGGVTAHELTRMDQAQEWLRIHLGGHHVERLCLSHWATSVAYHRPLRRLLQSRHWSRTTFYRRVHAGAFVISNALQADRVPVT